MEKQALEFLLRYSDWVKDAGFFSSIWHMFTMWVIKISYHIALYTEKVIDQIFKITGFLDEGMIGTVYTSMRILAASVLTVTLLYIVYKYMFSDRVDLKGSLLRGIIFLNLIIYLPGLMNSAMNVTKATFDASKDLHGTGSSLSYNIVQSNMADLTYLSRNGFELLDSSNTNDRTMNLSENAFKNADLTEMILPNDIGDLKKTASNEENTEALGYQIKVADDGSLYADKIKNGWFSTFDNGKFRFSADTATILISLWTMTFVYLCSGFTIGAAILELVFARILFPVLAAMDIETGQKVKRIFEDMGNTFVTIMLTGFSISLFSIYFTYLATLNLNIVAYAILCLVGVSMAMTGPRTFGKYLGVDTSARSGFKSIVGGYYGAKAAMGIGKSAVGLGEAALHAPETMRATGGKIKNGVSNKLDSDKKMMNNIGKAKDHIDDKLDDKVDEIFDNPPTTLDNISPISEDQYEEENLNQSIDGQENSTDEDTKNTYKNNGELDQDGKEIIAEADNSTHQDHNKVQDSADEKSVSDSELNTEGHDLSENPNDQGEETDENGKVIVQDSSNNEDKTVNDASSIETKGSGQRPENLKNEDPANNAMLDGSEGSNESDSQNKMNSTVENPDKKKVDQGSEEALKKNPTEVDTPPVTQNEGDSSQKQIVQSEQPTTARKEDNVAGNSSETVSKTTKSTNSDQGSLRKEKESTKPLETLESTDRTSYKESESKPIWEEKKQSDTRFASANDTLKNMNAEDYLPPRNNDRGDRNGE
ncbi:pLS20_p028 family conjugation system transmembrane protein [Enterococcus sp. AZ084]|uniref:pLS20_p028 family conjugation system transmembrane protein n=1 Tax=Enterococcus sp. AZ084 TaxID=2774671 RepID=UPI003F25F303